MAEETQSAGPQSNNSAANDRGGRRRGGGGGGRGSASQTSSRTDHRRNGTGRTDGDETKNTRGRGGGGSGGRNRRGRGGHNDDRNNNSSNNQSRTPASNSTAGRGGQPPPNADSDGSGTSSEHPAGDAAKPEGEATSRKQLVAPATDEPDDGEICYICASTVEHTSVAPCNHRTCHICALRLRAFYKNKACAHCRTESPFVIFTDDPAKRFEDFKTTDIARIDTNLGIQYEKDEIYEDTVILLRYNCPDKDCDVACMGWPDLHRHVKSKHGRSMCDLCTRNKKVFTHEHELFTIAQLRKHEKYGDDNPGAIDQSGFKGHPECEFCRERFYGDDELYAHCRDKHERCHICDRQPNNRQHQYYINYDALEHHFQQDHFLCLDKECLEKKFVVFESQMDLKAHQLETHPNGLSKDARRDARTVDISTFDYRAPYQPGRRGRGGGGREGRETRGAGRGRDPNADTIPVSSAQPLRRDELAYQRQVAIQSAQSVSTRSFGGQLTARENPAPATRPPTTRSPANTSPAPSRPALVPTTAMENLDLNNSTAAMTSLSPQEQARRLRHAAVVERASNLLQNDALKVSEFRTKVSNYRASVISATDLIDSFFSLFDTPTAELGKLIKELADIYEDENKRTALLSAWNNWRAINEDYPALPGPSGIFPGLSSNTTGSGGKRVLRLKSSTAQSSRSAVGRAGNLSSTSSGGALNPFPPLSSSSSTSVSPATSSASRRAAIAATSAPAWNSTPPTRPSVTTTSSYARPAPRASTGPAPRTMDRNAFPALPAAPKPNTLMAGLTRGTIRWDDRRGPEPAAWGAETTAPKSGSSTLADAEDGTSGSKKGKSKKGKQILFQFG